MGKLTGVVKHLMQLEVESSWQPIEQQATKEGRSFGPGQGVGQSVTPGWEKCWVRSDES